MPSETYWDDSIFFTELPVPPHAAGFAGHLIVLFIYHSEHYSLFLIS